MEAPQRQVEESGMPPVAGGIVRPRAAEPAVVTRYQAPRRASSAADGAQRCASGPGWFGGSIRTAPHRVVARRRRRQPTVSGIPSAVPLPGLSRAVRRPSSLPGAFRALSGTGAGLLVVDLASLENGGAGPVDRLECPAAGSQSAVHRQPQSFPDPALGTGKGFGEQDPGALRPPGSGGLGNALRLSAFIAGNLGGWRAVSGNLLSGSQLDPPGGNARARSHGPVP